MGMLLFYFFTALITSFLCSLFEAVLLTTPLSYLETINNKKGFGKIIKKMRSNIDKSLTAILTLNTVAHTIGAAGVGAEAVKLWGDAYLGIVSGVMTLLILIFTEIIPKSVGAFYWKNLLPYAAYMIQFFVYITYPVVYLSVYITRIFIKGESSHTVSRQEILAISDQARKMKVITKKEAIIIRNLLNLNKISVESVMTPRSVLFAAPENITIEEFLNYNNVNSFTRIPIFDKTIDMITGYVHKNDILQRLKDNNREMLLKDCKRQIMTVNEEISIFHLFEELLAKKEQIALIVDEFGGTAGVTTMEDIIETLLGVEILDEHDVDSDMQLLARNRYLRRIKR